MTENKFKGKGNRQDLFDFSLQDNFYSDYDSFNFSNEEFKTGSTNKDDSVDEYLYKHLKLNEVSQNKKEKFRVQSQIITQKKSKSNTRTSSLEITNLQISSKNKDLLQRNLLRKATYKQLNYLIQNQKFFLNLFNNKYKNSQFISTFFRIISNKKFSQILYNQHRPEVINIYLQNTFIYYIFNRIKCYCYIKKKQTQNKNYYITNLLKDTNITNSKVKDLVEEYNKCNEYIDDLFGFSNKTKQFYVDAEKLNNNKKNSTNIVFKVFNDDNRHELDIETYNQLIELSSLKKIYGKFGCFSKDHKNLFSD